jgi:putative holliday junction resolvase
LNEGKDKKREGEGIPQVSCDLISGFFVVESATVGMIVCDVRALSLDIGEKRIGFAISDSNQSIAQPLKLYKRGSLAQDIDEVKKLVSEYGVSRIVCGLPKNLDGSIGKKARTIMEFARKLEEKTNVPVDLWDERFSTDEAHRIFDMHEYKQKKRKPYIDMMAAQLILQGFLDAQKKG